MRDAAPEMPVKSGPYTEGVCSQAGPSNFMTGSCGKSAATCVYGLAWCTARMRP